MLSTNGRVALKMRNLTVSGEVRHRTGAARLPSAGRRANRAPIAKGGLTMDLAYFWYEAGHAMLAPARACDGRRLPQSPSRNPVNPLTHNAPTARRWRRAAKPEGRVRSCFHSTRLGSVISASSALDAALTHRPAPAFPSFDETTPSDGVPTKRGRQVVCGAGRSAGVIPFRPGSIGGGGLPKPAPADTEGC